MTKVIELEGPVRVRILRLPEVQRRTGLSRSTIYVRLDRGLFPKPVSLGARAVGWIESEVDEWIRERIAESRGDSMAASPGEGETPRQRM
ncbi:MAG: AlpA family transcriptional regulator [Gemmatimonadetes bacterium]|nr:AlpA family transcriptional regulator [Gemmatimonadota bacterium]